MALLNIFNFILVSEASISDVLHLNLHWSQIISSLEVRSKNGCVLITEICGVTMYHSGCASNYVKH